MKVSSSFLLSLFLAVAVARAEWTPPAKPDPSKILQEAARDVTAQRYEEALEKHVWYHENALKIEPAQYGVRLSFALSAWHRLGLVYPPALEKLTSIRDENERTLREAHGTDEKSCRLP